jgi:hypothetical protein
MTIPRFLLDEHAWGDVVNVGIEMGVDVLLVHSGVYLAPKRDTFVEGVFKAARLPLAGIPVRQSYPPGQ